MNRLFTKVLSVFIILTAVCALPSAAQESKYKMHVKGDLVYRGQYPYTIRAVEAQIFGEYSVPLEDRIIALNRIAQFGGTAPTFDLLTYSDTGESLNPETVNGILGIMGDVQWRSMIFVIRVLPKELRKDEKFNKTAIRTAAEAFKKESRVVYVIDGDDSEALCKEFHKVNKDAVIIAPKGGDIDLVQSWPAETKRPTMLFNAVPPNPLDDRAHCIFPDTPETLARLDEGLMTPEEKQPWTPDNSMLTEQERADGWISLFDGKSLNGWFIVGANKNGFAAKDGMLIWNERGGASLRTVKRYDNYILKCEWKINKGGNNGIHLRAPRAGRSSKIGMEYQIMGDYGAPISNDITGCVYDVVEPMVAAGKPDGEWNETEIILDGSHLTFKLNGQTTVDLNMDEHPELKYRIRTGFICITDHSHPAWFRNIKLKQL